MTIKEIQKKYNCTETQAINIKSKLNTPEELGLKAKVVKSHQDKIQSKIEKG